MTRACDCGAPIGARNESGRCRPCSTRRLHADPTFRGKRLAGLRAYHDSPGAREAAGERLRSYMRELPDDDRERRRAHGHHQAKLHLLRPDVVARSQDPATRKAAGRKAVLAWIAKGWLRAAQKTPEMDGSPWRITPAAIRAFVIDNVSALQLGRVDPHWFADLLAHGARS